MWFRTMMAQATRSCPGAVDRLAGLNLLALLLFLGAEIILLFVWTPSKAVLEFAGPICHYGIIVSLLAALVLVLMRQVLALLGRRI